MIIKAVNKDIQKIDMNYLDVLIIKSSQDFFNSKNDIFLTFSIK